MWRMLLPYYLLFLISIFFFKLTYLHYKLSRTELARLVMKPFFLVMVVSVRPYVSNTHAYVRMSI